MGKETSGRGVLPLKDPSYPWIQEQAWQCGPCLASLFLATTPHYRKGVTKIWLPGSCLCHILYWVNVCGKMYGVWGQETKDKTTLKRWGTLWVGDLESGESYSTPGTWSKWGTSILGCKIVWTTQHPWQPLSYDRCTEFFLGIGHLVKCRGWQVWHNGSYLQETSKLIGKMWAWKDKFCFLGSIWEVSGERWGQVL